MGKRLAAVVLAAGVILAGLLGGAAPLSAHGAGGGEHPECIRHEAKARWWGYGYRHYVVLDNECAELAACRVSTSSNPATHHARVPAGEKTEILVHTASPAYSFTATVDCELVR